MLHKKNIISNEIGGSGVQIKDEKQITDMGKKTEQVKKTKHNFFSRVKLFLWSHYPATKKDIQNLQKKLGLLDAKLSNISSKTDSFVEIINSKDDLLESKYYLLERKLLEITWAEIWNNTITNSDWLLDKTFSPGRFAVGYQYLYVLYRVLDEIKPHTILEIGLSQSSKMICQYIEHNCGTEFICIEQSNEWIQFFSKNYQIPDAANIVQLDTAMENFINDSSVRVYKGFKEKLSSKKFSFICVDGPISSDMLDYARIDILNILPDCLEDSFVILLDDSQRKAETNTMKLIRNKLNDANIKFSMRAYRGQVDTTIICSEDLKFLCSL